MQAGSMMTCKSGWQPAGTIKHNHIVAFQRQNTLSTRNVVELPHEMAPHTNPWKKSMQSCSLHTPPPPSLPQGPCHKCCARNILMGRPMAWKLIFSSCIAVGVADEIEIASDVHKLTASYLESTESVFATKSQRLTCGAVRDDKRMVIHARKALLLVQS